MVSEKELTIRFDSRTNSIYEIGYLLVDIYQLIVFSEELENENFEFLEKHYFDKKRKYVQRNSSILKKLRNNAEVKTVKPGSIEIVLAGIGVFSSIIVPFIVNKLNQNKIRKNEAITLEISTNDNYVNSMINMTQNGYFGDESWRYLLEQLSRRGYSVEALSENTFRVLEMANAMEKRMVKVIPKYTPNDD